MQVSVEKSIWITVLTSTGTVITLLTAAWKISKPHFQKAVLLALSDQSPAYRKFNDSLYADWREEQVSTKALSEATHAAIVRLESEVRDSRMELREHRDQLQQTLARLAALPESLRYLADAVKTIADTQRRMTQQLHDTELELARMKGRDDRRSHLDAPRARRREEEETEDNEDPM